MLKLLFHLEAADFKDIYLRKSLSYAYRGRRKQAYEPDIRQAFFLMIKYDGKVDYATVKKICFEKTH